MDSLTIMKTNPTICVVGDVDESSGEALRERLRQFVEANKDQPLPPKAAELVRGH